MTDEQVWEDLSRFAQAMKRGARVVFCNGSTMPNGQYGGHRIDANCVSAWGGIREIIEPPQKRIRPLNAEEWRNVRGCLIYPECEHWAYVPEYEKANAAILANGRFNCHPPGFPNDVRKLWVEE